MIIEYIIYNYWFRFVYVPTPYTTEVLSDVLVDYLFDWNLDRKLSTLTIDNLAQMMP